MNASVSVVCYKSKVLSNGKSLLMLRVTKDRKPKYVSLGIAIFPKYWDFEKNKPTPRCPNKELIEKIILDKQVEYQRQILEFVAEQKELEKPRDFDPFGHAGFAHLWLQYD